MLALMLPNPQRLCWGHAHQQDAFMGEACANIEPYGLPGI
jgi:hypothetical protein